MGAPGRYYHEEFAFLRGMDGGRAPNLVLPSQVAKSVNVTFRGGRPKTRPLFRHIDLTFEDEEKEKFFRSENVQGMGYYNPDAGISAVQYSVTNESLILSIGGKQFAIYLGQKSGNVVDISPKDDPGNDPNKLHSWMIQAENYFIIQDGYSPAIIFDGKESRRSKGLNNGEVPTGASMAYLHGRLWVSDIFNRIFAGDIIHASNQTNTEDVLKFTETGYWAEGGYFSRPTMMGEITALVYFPLQDTAQGQGELLVPCALGLNTIQAGIFPRTAWQDSPMQKVALLEGGVAGPYAFCYVNGDIFSRDQWGIQSYRSARADANRLGGAKSTLSYEVMNWLDYDDKQWLRFASLAWFDNRVLCTTQPVVSGKYRWHRGMVALNFDSLNSINDRQPPEYDGLWTGIRPIAIVTGRFGYRLRCFVISHDPDKVNRLYEITTEYGDDVGPNGEVEIESFIESRRFAFKGDADASAPFKRFTLGSGQLWFSDLVGKNEFSIEYKTDESPCWNMWRDFEKCSNVPCRTNNTPCLFRFPKGYIARYNLGDPSEECINGTNSLSGNEFQVRISWKGNATLNRYKFGAIPVAEDENIDCDVPECFLETCCDKKDFSYKIG